jgi:hypothetical protein
MAHRIREAMKSNGGSLLGGPGSSGIVEADETFYGTANEASGKPLPKSRNFQHKMPILSLVERNGEKRSFDFRWNTRQSQGFTDTDRANIALKGISGKRLLYKGPHFQAASLC